MAARPAPHPAPPDTPAGQQPVSPFQSGRGRRGLGKGCLSWSTVKGNKSGYPGRGGRAGAES